MRTRGMALMSAFAVLSAGGALAVSLLSASILTPGLPSLPSVVQIDNASMGIGSNLFSQPRSASTTQNVESKGGSPSDLALIQVEPSNKVYLEYPEASTQKSGVESSDVATILVTPVPTTRPESEATATSNAITTTSAPPSTESTDSSSALSTTTTTSGDKSSGGDN